MSSKMSLYGAYQIHTQLIRPSAVYFRAKRRLSYFSKCVILSIELDRRAKVVVAMDLIKIIVGWLHFFKDKQPGPYFLPFG